MLPRFNKLPTPLSYFAPCFGDHDGTSPVASVQYPASIPHTSAGRSPSNHTPTRSAPDSLLPRGSPTLQPHKSQPPIRLFGSKNESANSSQSTALSVTANNQVPLRPPPGLSDDPGHDILHAAGGSSLQCHKPQHSIRPHRSESNVVESLRCATAPSMPNNQHLRQPLHQPLHAPRSYGDPAALRVHEATTTSFLAGAFDFRMGDLHCDEASHKVVSRGGGVGDNSIDGMSKFIGILPEDGH
jgi:hypothetical protein